MPPTSRRTLTRVLAAALLATTLPLQATEAWPHKTVRIIVPFAPGGGADVSARVLAELLAPELGQAVIVENKPGAGSAIGVSAAAVAKDGHTLLMGSNSMVINPAFNPTIGYDVARDFDAVGMVSAQPLVLVVPDSFPARTMAELIAQVKAKPGVFSAGNSGNGTLAHLTSQIFEEDAGLQLISVPYKGEAALMPDLLSGLVSMGFLNLPSVATHIQSGRLRALAVSSPLPVPSLPGVPTLRSLKLPGLEVQGWAALLASKGSIPEPGLARLEQLLGRALASETVKLRFAALNVAPVIQGRQATAQFLAAEGRKYANIIKTKGITRD